MGRRTGSGWPRDGDVRQEVCILEIEIPAELAELLLIRAAEQEVSVEEIVERAIQNFMKRGENHAE